MLSRKTHSLRPTIDVVYHFFPHYRRPVLEELSRSEEFSFKFWGSKTALEGIRPFVGNENVIINEIGRRDYGKIYKLNKYNRIIFNRDSAAVVMLGNPNIIDTWIIALLSRLRGKKVIFWTHGWLKPEGKFKSIIRNAYYGLAHRVMVYGERAVELAEQSGFPRKKVSAIYNSLDWKSSSDIFAQLSESDNSRFREFHSIQAQSPIIVCTARLTNICRFDLLLEAMSIIKADGQHTTLLLVGDGPERENLEMYAKELGVDARFLGAIYDESQIAELIYHSDVTVSPGKVGLTAMHSLTYGTPVITHSDLDEQMPEVEAVVSGVSGDFFERGNSAALAVAIKRYLTEVKTQGRENVRAACRGIIEQKWNPRTQRILIEKVVREALNG